MFGHNVEPLDTRSIDGKTILTFIESIVHPLVTRGMLQANKKPRESYEHFPKKYTEIVYF